MDRRACFSYLLEAARWLKRSVIVFVNTIRGHLKSSIERRSKRIRIARRPCADVESVCFTSRRYWHSLDTTKRPHLHRLLTRLHGCCQELAMFSACTPQNMDRLCGTRLFDIYCTLLASESMISMRSRHARLCGSDCH